MKTTFLLLTLFFLSACTTYREKREVERQQEAGEEFFRQMAVDPESIHDYHE